MKKLEDGLPMCLLGALGGLAFAMLIAVFVFDMSLTAGHIFRSVPIVLVMGIIGWMGGRRKARKAEASARAS